MPFDTSNVAATVGQGQTPQNPAALLSELAGAQNALNQNKMFQAKAIAAQYLQQSTGPDGSPDPGKLNRFLLADQRTAPYAPEIMANSFGLKTSALHNVAQGLANTGAGIANQRAGVGLKSDQTALTGAYTGNLRQDLATVPPSTNPDPAAAEKENSRNAAMAVANGVASGRYPQEFATNFLGGSATPDGTTLGTAIRSAAISGAGGAGAQEAQFGSPTAINTGGATNIENINRVTGAVTPMGKPIVNTLSPGEKAAGVPVIGPDGAPVRQTVGSLVTPTGDARPGAAPVLGFSPGHVAAADTAGTGSATQLINTRADAAGAQGRILVLNKALHGLQTSNTGPGTVETNNVSSFLLAQTPESLRKYLPGVDPTKIKNFDEANKYLTQYAAGAASAYGPGTDAKLATAASGNASTHISNLAAQDVVKVNIGLERMKQAQIAAFEASHLPPEDFGSFAANWSRTVDPRAFMIDKLNKTERAALMKSLSPTEKANFRNGVRSALSSGGYSAADLSQ